MLDVFNTPSPQSANYQEFFGGNTATSVYEKFTWVKPRGASMVRMLLIGGGAGGRSGSTTAGGAGGGSGSVTSWIGPAMFIPDDLRVVVGGGGGTDNGGFPTAIYYDAKNVTDIVLLYANGGTASGGAAFSNNYFGASGIFRSVLGQNGASAGTAITPSTLIFLSGGAGGSNSVSTGGGIVSANYGYPTVTGNGIFGAPGGNGYFITQPFLLGTGGSGGGGNSGGTGGTGGSGGIGCGGGGGGRGSTAGGAGGNGGGGAVFIWTW